GHSLRLSVPLLGIILLLPLLKVPENWTWVTQKAVGILFIVTLSFLIVHGITGFVPFVVGKRFGLAVYNLCHRNGVIIRPIRKIHEDTAGLCRDADASDLF